jgi:hypothetical protein
MSEPKPPDSTALDIIIHPDWRTDWRGRSFGYLSPEPYYPTWNSWEGLRAQLSQLVPNVRILLILEGYFEREFDRSHEELEVLYLVF